MLKKKSLENIQKNIHNNIPEQQLHKYQKWSQKHPSPPTSSSFHLQPPASLKITWRKSLINKHIKTRSYLSNTTCTRAEKTLLQRKAKHLSTLLEYEHL